jgi:cytidine deaminase
MFDPVTLIKKALEARENAYSPYSRFCVGAALICSDGELFLGANVENSSFGGTICAERSAFCAAISQGKRDFEAISIVGGFKDKQIEKLCAPCGICRQFMSEFCSADFPVVLYDGKSPVIKTLGELLPETFELKEE